MKKWLRIFLLVTCLIGLTPLLRIQAQKQATIVQTAAFQDQTGTTVTSLQGHRLPALYLNLQVNVPVGKTLITLVAQDEAHLRPGTITDLQPAQAVRAMVDSQQRLVLQNDQEQAQVIDLRVPVKVTDPLLVSHLQLELRVEKTAETFVLPTLKVTVNAASESAATATTASSHSRSTTTDQRHPVSASSSGQTTVSQRSQSTKQRARAGQSSSASTSSTTKASADDEAEPDAKTTSTKTSRAAVTTPALPTATRDIHRAQIQIGSWSDELEIGGSLGTPANIKGPKTTSGDNTYWNDKYASQYYYSYQQATHARAYAVVLNQVPQASDTIVVRYQNVGAYAESAQDEALTKKMGAILTISNIKHNSNTPAGDTRYIDFSNNFYSGIVYNGIASFDLDVTFISEDGQQQLKFPSASDDGEYNSYFTFGSLNGNNPGEHEWAGTRSGIKGVRTTDTLVKERRRGWYEGIGEGVWEKDKPYTGKNQWGDFLGSTNYERGAVSFPMVGTTQLFKLKGESGFTWQSFSSGYLVPLEAPAPQKTVHRTAELGLENNNLDGVTVDRDQDDLASFYYTIYQPTYSIPDESIAKPNKIILTDQLPAGMTVKASDIRLFNTDGQLIPTSGDITVTQDGHVTYQLSNKEIETLLFDGQPFAFQMKVTFADSFVGTFENRALVTFDSGEKYFWEKSTNEVVTHFQRDLTQLTLKKVGDLPWDPTASVGLDQVTFTVTAENGQQMTVKTNQVGEATLKNLSRQQTYTVTEQVPAGYVHRQSFKLAYDQASQRWQVTGDQLQVSISDDAAGQVITVTNQLARGAYRFQKIDSTTEKALTGAEFIVQNADQQYLTFDQDGQLTGVVANREQATKLTGDANGAFRVTGLPYGDYQLIETKAPAGYTLGAAHKFTVSKTPQSVPDQIENDPYSLPVTGGQGIIWFIVLGLILTLSSLAIWRTHPRGE